MTLNQVPVWTDAGAPQTPAQRPGIVRRLIAGTAMYLLPILVVAGGIIGAVRLIETGPQAKRRPPEKQATLVQVDTVSKTSTNAMIQVMGTVKAAQEIMLQPRVSGEIVKLSPNFVPGGHFAAGDFMLQIDPKDYELAVEKTKGELAQAEYELKLEEGHQEIAKREWDLMNMKDEASALDRELALRKPQLLKAQATLKSAQAALHDAQLDLERTTIRAPFNCMIIREDVDLGAQVAAQTDIATLVGTSEYWVQAAIPVDQLRWIRFPNEQGEGGSEAVIRQELGTGVQGQWRGNVVRLLGDLEPQGRMARVLIAVPDPLHLEAPDSACLPLLIDAYVNVTIEGRELDDVIALPRTALRGESKVWIMNNADELEIRDVDVVWRNRDTVLVQSGIEPGERIVVSDLPAPVEKMALAVQNDKPELAAESTEQADVGAEDAEATQ